MDTASSLAFFKGHDLPLQPELTGSAQLRRYTPIDPLSGRLPYQIFNVYLPTGLDKNAKLERLLSLLLEAPGSDLAHFLGWRPQHG